MGDPSVTVVAEGTPVEDVSPVPVAGPQSPLALLQGKRQALEAKLYLDLAVPRWEEHLGRRLWVRYGPGDPGVFAGAVARREAAQQETVRKGGQADPDLLVKANADLLVASCVAVYDLALDEEPPEGDLPPNLPTFGSPELSQALGAAAGAVPTALKLYGTSADLMLAANRLLEWSGESSREAKRGFLAS